MIGWYGPNEISASSWKVPCCSCRECCIYTGCGDTSLSAFITGLFDISLILLLNKSQGCDAVCREQFLIFCKRKCSKCCRRDTQSCLNPASTIPCFSTDMNQQIVCSESLMLRKSAMRQNIASIYELNIIYTSFLKQ